MSKPITQTAPPRPHGHWRLLYKILISIVGFLVAFGLSQLVPTGQQGELIWSIGASLFVAGIVFIAQYLFEVEKRLDNVENTVKERMDSMEGKFDRHISDTTERLQTHAEDTERQMTEGFSKIHLATELFSLREASQLNPDEMRQMTKLVRSSTKITSEAPSLVHEFAQAEIARLADYLKQLGDGSDLTYEGEDRDWLIGLTKVAQRSIRATSLSTVDAGGQSFIDGGLWRSDLGQRYVEEQQLAIARGVKIQRIFIIDRKDFNLTDPHLQEVLESHLHIGVDVRTLEATASPAIHPKLRDFIVFDEVLSYQSTPATHMPNLNPIIVNTSLVTNPIKVIERRRLFDQLWNHPNVSRVSIGAANKLVFTPIGEPSVAG